MGDKDGFFAGIGKVYMYDKPIDLIGAQPNIEELHEIGNFSANGLSVDGDGSSETEESHFTTGVPFTATLNFEIADKKGQQLCRKLLRLPKLPRKLKKRVKKAYFIKYPKRIDRYTLNYAFALNNPHRARKVKMVAIPKDILIKSDK